MDNKKSMIPRSKEENRKIQRVVPKRNIRESDEVSAAYQQLGDSYKRGTDDWYTRIYNEY